MEKEDEDLLDMEEEVPATGLSALVSEDPRSFLIENARKRAEERSKLFQGELDRLEAAKKKLLAQPTQFTRQEALRAIASRLTQRPSDPRDPRFFEKRNLFSTLRDIGEVGGEMSAAEKKLKEEQAAKVAQLEEMRGRYLYGEAERGEREAATALARYRPPAVSKLQADAQKIIDFQSIVDDTSKPEQVRKAAQREIDSIGRRNTPQDNSTLAQILRANNILAISKDPNERKAAELYLNKYQVKPSSLTLSQERTDERIRRAQEFLKTVDEKERKAAFNNPFPNERQRQIIEATRVSRDPMFSEVSAAGNWNIEPADDEEE